MKIRVIDFGYTKLPLRAHYNDSGADLFAISDVIIQPHTVESIGTGIGVYLPDGYDLVIYCKSGLSKNGIWCSNAPVDSGYRGEIHAILFNTTNTPYKITAGDKLGQAVIRPVIYADFVETIGNERDIGAFGSTGK